MVCRWLLVIIDPSGLLMAVENKQALIECCLITLASSVTQTPSSVQV